MSSKGPSKMPFSVFRKTPEFRENHLLIRSKKVKKRNKAPIAPPAILRPSPTEQPKSVDNSPATPPRQKYKWKRSRRDNIEAIREMSLNRAIKSSVGSGQVQYRLIVAGLWAGMVFVRRNEVTGELVLIDEAGNVEKKPYSIADPQTRFCTIAELAKGLTISSAKFESRYKEISEDLDQEEARARKGTRISSPSSGRGAINLLPMSPRGRKASRRI